jgi:hypothetical protein
MKKILLIIVGIIIVIFAAVFIVNRPDTAPVKQITSFEECVAAGNPVMESYPEQCRTEDGELFVRNVGNEVEKMDLIQITSPRPGETVSSPLIITGKARGNWYFEASFPITVVDWNGLIIGQGHAEAQGEWMTTEFVPFKATVTFNVPTSTPYRRGSLILQKDNPSGLSQNDDALEIPVLFK